MRWPEVREVYPDQWLVIEALEAHSEENQRILNQIAVVEACPDSVTAMQTYRRLHQQHPAREFYFVHTSRDSLEIEERRWAGIRTEAIFTRQVDRVQLGQRAVGQFEIEVGGMDYGFDINGILGMDFLRRIGAIINLHRLQIEYSDPHP